MPSPRDLSAYAYEVVGDPRSELEHYEGRAKGFGLSRLEFDLTDACPSLRELVNLRFDGRVVAVARVGWPSEDMARRDGSATGLHLGAVYDDRVLAGRRIAEIMRVAVIPEFRGTFAAPLVIEASLDRARRRGYDTVVGLANCETSEDADGDRIVRVLNARGLMDDRLSLAKRSQETTAPASRTRTWFYTAAERRSIAAGDCAKLRIPRTLALYARWGATFVGVPRRNDLFGLLELPLIARVPESPRFSFPAPSPSAPRHAA